MIFFLYTIAPSTIRQTDKTVSFLYVRIHDIIAGFGGFGGPQFHGPPDGPPPFGSPGFEGGFRGRGGRGRGGWRGRGGQDGGPASFSPGGFDGFRGGRGGRGRGRGGFGGPGSVVVRDCIGLNLSKTNYPPAGGWNDGPMEGGPPFPGPRDADAGFDNFDE